MIPIPGMEGLIFGRPELLWLVPIVLGVGLFLSRKAKGKSIVITRTVVLSLLLIAIANPYVVAYHTVESTRPRICVLSDETPSMELFDSGTAERVSGLTSDSVLRYFGGESTAIGDRILQYYPQGDVLVLVTDGNSNQGTSVSDALSLARAGNATVFAIKSDPLIQETGVEIDGMNTAVMGGDYPFKVVVRSTGPAGGRLIVLADDSPISELSLSEINGSIQISHRFSSTGSHTLKAVITPDRDHFQQNNEYTKGIYVVPKPQVLLISETTSPLQTVLNELYDLSTAKSLDETLSGTKAVVIDDMPVDEKFDRLKQYVLDGGGLVVVGGPVSYELGGYYNSSFEEVLPVVSSPAKFEGGKLVVLVLDISGSTMSPIKTGESTSYMDYEKSLAIELLSSTQLRDAQVGVVVFGTKGYVVSNPVPLARSRTMLESAIKSLQTPLGKDETHLDDGLRLARNMLNSSKGDAEMIVISDGQIDPGEMKSAVFDRSVELLKDLNVRLTLIQVQAFEGASGRFDELAGAVGGVFYPAIYPGSLSIFTPQDEGGAKGEALETKEVEGYPLVVTDANHYITKDIEINTSVRGFNDVTNKAGSQRLVALEDGKPILTVWRYGLGRVVCLTTDDGNAWAQNLYGEDSSILISSAVNWAVGDPRPEKERIDYGDGWRGTPLVVAISSPAPPAIDGDLKIRMDQVGEGRYTATFTPQTSGIYYIGDYGISVNYPIEYRDVGFNPEFVDAIESSGGRVFTEDEARTSLIVEARRSAQKTVQEKVSKGAPLLLAALLIFLSEIILRRMREVRQKGRGS